MPLIIKLKLDKKTVIFFGSFLCMAASVLWPLFKELYDALTIYTADPPDWQHIWTTHGPAVMTAFAGFWVSMKAKGLTPDWITDVIDEDTLKEIVEAKKVVDESRRPSQNERVYGQADAPKPPEETK